MLVRKLLYFIIYEFERIFEKVMVAKIVLQSCLPIKLTSVEHAISSLQSFNPELNRNSSKMVCLSYTGMMTR